MMPLILNLAVMCKKFIVIGISDSRELFLPPRVLDIIAGSRVFSGGVRHHGIVASLLPADAVWIDISVPLEAVYEHIENTILRWCSLLATRFSMASQ